MGLGSFVCPVQAIGVTRPHSLQRFPTRPQCDWVTFLLPLYLFSLSNYVSKICFSLVTAVYAVIENVWGIYLQGSSSFNLVISIIYSLELIEKKGLS